MTNPDFFPENYEAARTHFRRLSDQILKSNPRAVAGTFVVPSEPDEQLTVDELYVPPDSSKDTEASSTHASSMPKTLWIFTSGVHGLEAATGSAIQSMFIREILPEFANSPASRHVGFWFVHCLNPWGFKHGRRVTKSNINLNRNFAPDASTFKTPNAGYRILSPFFEHVQPVAYSSLATYKTLAFLFKNLLSKKFTAASLNQALGQGQFEFPKGLEYGGTYREPQVDFFAERFNQLISDYQDIVLCDLHTGLGEKGRLHLIPGSDQVTCAHPDLLARFLRLGLEDDLYQFTPSNEKGFYKTVGDINSFTAAAAGPSKRVLALTLEFGTLGNGFMAKVETLTRLWLENRGHHFGYRDEHSKKTIRGLYREIFEPTEAAWRANCLGLSRHLLKRFSERLFLRRVADHAPDHAASQGSGAP